MLMGAFFGAWGADITGELVRRHRHRARRRRRHRAPARRLLRHLRADQIVSGTAINFLALGITGYLFVKIYGEQGTPDDLPQIPDVHLPIGWIPFIGDALEQLNLLIWLALILVALLSLFLFRTARGLRLRSVGENPLAADTAGISPIRVRYLGGDRVRRFRGAGRRVPVDRLRSLLQPEPDRRQGLHRPRRRDLRQVAAGGRAGRGLLFGFSSALAQRLPVFSPSTATLFQALPYVLTLIAVAGLVGRSRPPAADGIPYERH